MTAYRKPLAYRNAAAYRDAGAPQTLVVEGFDALAFGADATIWNRNQTVIAEGLAAFRGFGEHWVTLAIRRIRPGLGEQTLWGTAELGGGVRELDLSGRGIPAARYGKPIVWFAERVVAPSWFVATLTGTPMVDRHHYVDPDGIDSAAFGQAEAHFPRQTLDLLNQGIPGPAWGDAEVKNWEQDVFPDGFNSNPEEALRFGRPEVQLWQRYLVQLFEVTPFDGGVFGRFTEVVNRNQNPHAEGFDMARVGEPEIANNARLIRTPAFQDFSAFGTALVTYKIRTLGPEGTESASFGRWLVVYNDARVLAPAGIEPGGFGTATVGSNLQTLTYVGGVDSAAPGSPMVAFRVRTIAPYGLPDPPYPGEPVVELWERTIAPSGWESRAQGVPTLEEHFTIIGAHSVLPPTNAFGEGRVWNRTPELHTSGWTHTEYGTPAVHNEWEAYSFEGFSNLVFGRHVVRDRTSTIGPIGVAPRPISQLHEVRNVEPDPPASRILGVSGAEHSEMGSPTLTFNSIYPLGGVHVEFGSASLVVMGFRPLSILPPVDEATGTQFGLPAFAPTQYIEPPGMDWTAWGKPAFWPHYIWAPRGYPYPTGEGEHGELMDHDVHAGHSERPVFGRPTVTHYHRTITQQHGLADNQGDFARYGENARVSLNPQKLRMEGTRFSRFGIPRLNDANEAQCYGFDMASLGTPALHIPVPDGPQTAKPSGIGAPDFGTARVEHFHRAITPAGFDAFTMSPPKPPGAPSWPQTWTWVSHEYDPFPIPGFDATLWGNAWISHRIRTIYPEGADTAVVAEYVPGNFADRMRVRPRDYVREAGLGDLGAFGTTRVELGERTIRHRWGPVGQAGAPSLRATATIVPGGWDSAAYGDVQKWEAGKIKPHGDDLARYGRAIIDRALHAIGFAGAVGEPRIGAAIGAAGFDASAVPVPVAIARVCGNKAMAVAGFDAAQFGGAFLGLDVAGSVQPFGLAGIAWGNPRVALTVVTDGEDAAALGTPELGRPPPRSLALTGFDAAGYGTADLPRVLNPDGFDGIGWGDVNLHRTVPIEGFIAFNPPAIIYYHGGTRIRMKLLPDGWDSAATGEPTVELESEVGGA